MIKTLIELLKLTRKSSKTEINVFTINIFTYVPEKRLQGFKFKKKRSKKDMKSRKINKYNT